MLTKNLFVSEDPVIQSTAAAIELKSPPFFATVMILGSWFTSYSGASIGISVLRKVSVPSTCPVAVGCSTTISFVLFSKFRALPNILGAVPWSIFRWGVIESAVGKCRK